MNDGSASPSALPGGWVWTTLGEIVLPQRPRVAPDPESDLPFIGMDSIAPGGLAPIRVGRFREMKSAGSRFHKGDVLYGRLRPYLNKVWCAQYDGVASAEFIVFPANEFVDGQFLAFLLHHRRFVHFASHVVSGDRPRVDVSDIKNFPVALPPTPEQKRIAARATELFGEIEAAEQELEKAHEALETYRRALLKAAFAGELTNEWRRGNGTGDTAADLLAHISQQRAPRVVVEWAVRTESLPVGWAWTTVGQLFQVFTGSTPSRAEPTYCREEISLGSVVERLPFRELLGRVNG